LEEASCPLFEYFKGCSKISERFVSETRIFRQAFTAAATATSQQRESRRYACCCYRTENRNSFHGTLSSICLGIFTQFYSNVLISIDLQEFQPANLVSCCSPQIVMMIEPSICSKNLTTIELLSTSAKLFYSAYPCDLSRLGEEYAAPASIENHLIKVLSKYVFSVATGV